MRIELVAEHSLLSGVGAAAAVLRHRRAGDHPVQPAHLQADLFLQAEQYFPRFKIAAALENIIQPLGGKEAFVFRLLLLVEAPAQIMCIVIHIV